MSFHLLDKEQKQVHSRNSLMYRDGQDKVLLFLEQNFCLGYDFEEKQWYKQMQLPTKEKLPGDIFYNSEGLYYMSGTYYKYEDDEDAFEDRKDILVWKYDSATNCSLERDSEQ